MSSAVRLEIHAGDGGADAALFARELADSIARHATATDTDGRTFTVRDQGRVLVLDCL